MADGHVTVNGATDAGAQAAYLLRMHALQKLDAALGGHSGTALAVLVVKGAALAMTHYAKPWKRAMVDIDFIVRPGSRGRVLSALVEHGFVVDASVERPWSHEFFGETTLTLACGALAVPFELHTTLDKLVARPVDHEAIFARAAPARGLSHLRLPAAEDHVLLLALHAAGHDFRHAPACADLDLLFARGLDEGRVLHRARQWRLETALFVMLSLLREGGSINVPEGLLRAIEPSGLRRAVVRRYRAHIADPSAALRLGWPWIARQTVLRDDLAVWVRGVVHYAVVRAAEAALLRAPEAP
jgi:hypothetical protein